MRKILSIIIVTILSLFIITEVVQADIPIAPTEPTVINSDTVAEYNDAVDIYNNEVDIYNSQVDIQYMEDLQTYNDAIAHNQEEDLKVQEVNNYNQAEDERVAAINLKKEQEAEIQKQEAEAHNAEEDAKVEENNQALAQQEALNEEIAAYAALGITSARVDNSDNLPYDWTPTVTVETAQSILVEPAEEPAEETYNVLNVFLYVDEETPFSMTTTGSEFDYPLEVSGHLVLGEWECVTVNKNDIVTVINEAELLGATSAALVRKMPGYTNGYWLSSYNMISYNISYLNDLWRNGVAHEFSYMYDDYAENIMNITVYNFIRLGDEPNQVDPYIPDYWDTEIIIDYEQPIYQEYIPDYITVTEPVKGAYLSKINYLSYEPESSTEEETTSEEEETTSKEEETTIQKEIITQEEITTQEETTTIKEIPTIEKENTIIDIENKNSLHIKNYVEECSIFNPNIKIQETEIPSIYQVTNKSNTTISNNSSLQKDVPHTGDTNNTMTYVIISVISILVISIAVLWLCSKKI